MIDRIKEFTRHDVFKRGDYIYFATNFPNRWTIAFNVYDLENRRECPRVTMTLYRLRRFIKRGEFQPYNDIFYGENDTPGLLPDALPPGPGGPRG